MRKFKMAAVIAVGLTGALQAAPAAQATSYRLIIAPGTSMRDTLRLNEQQQVASRLRRAWIAAGHTAPRDTTTPTITSLSVKVTKLDPTVPPAAPTVKVSFTTGSSGLGGLYMFFYSRTTNQSLEVTYYPDGGAPLETSGTVVLQEPFGANIRTFTPTSLGLYAASGEWALDYVYVYDQAGNYNYYESTAFPNATFSVKNPNADVTAPMVSAGKVLTLKVSASATTPTFSTRLTVSDDLSGVVSTTVDVSPPNESFGFGSLSFAASPVLSGTLENDNVLFNYDDPGAPPQTGTWTITGYEACDVAGNCLDDYNSADVMSLFGTTTFKVTK